MNPVAPSGPPSILLAMGGFAVMGGIEVFARDLAEFLIRSGFRVTLAYWPIRHQSPLLGEMKDIGCEFVRGWVTRGVRHDLPDAFLARRISGVLEQHSLVIFLKLFSDGIMRRLLDRMATSTNRRIASIYIPSFCPEEDETYRDRSKPDPRVLNRLDAVMAQCPVMARQTKHWLGYDGKLFTIPLLSSIRRVNVVPWPEFGEGRPRMKVSYIGRLTKQKNVGALLDAYAVLLEKHEDNLPYAIDLRLWGDGADREALLRHPCVLSHPDRVTFAGPYASRDLPEIAASTHFFVQTTQFEGQCLAALEVMAMGRPLIATRAGCLDDVIDDVSTGSVLPQGDPLRFADSMAETGRAIFEGRVDPWQIARSFEARFSREILEPKYLAMIAEVMGGKGSAR